MEKIGNSSVIITMDSNAKSGLWFSTETDERGKILKEFLLHNNLYVINEPNNIPTYMTTRGELNIDVTLINGNVLNSIKKWKVQQDCTTSDHSLITFYYNRPLNNQRQFYKQDTYNIKRANWDDFERLINDEFHDEVIFKLATANAEDAVELFTSVLRKICNRSIPKKKRGDKSVPWWTLSLNRMRRASNSARKQYIRARKLNLAGIEEYAETYKKRTRNKYTSEIRKCKRETWQEFVTREGNKDSWSIAYKIAREKLRVTETACSLVLPTGEVTMNWKDTFDALMEKAVPPDEMNNEDKALAN